MNDNLAENFLRETIAAFRNYKSLADKAIAQVSDDEFFARLDAESNGIALIVKHLAGNFRSRWTQFLTTDGEKPDRDRDHEFETSDDDGKEKLLESWERGWQILFASIESLQPADLTATVTIRGQAHTVLEAANRALAHCAYHVGQIVFLAKHFRASEWQSLSVPRGQSGKFNNFAAEKTDSTNRFETVRNFLEQTK